MRKRFLSFLPAVAMVITMVPGTALSREKVLGAVEPMG